MTRMMLTVLALALFVAPVQAQLPPLFGDEPWTTADSWRQGVYIGLTVLDWDKTLRIVDDPHRRERNPFLGPEPSRGKVNLLIGGSIVAHTVIATQLNRPYREGWQYFWMFVEALAVYHGCRVEKHRTGKVCGDIGSGFSIRF